MSEQKTLPPVRLSSLLDRVCKELDIQEGLKLYRVFEIWEETVGEIIAKKAAPEIIKNEILIVKVSSSTWIQELYFIKEEIKKKLNEKLGDPLIKDINFQIGKVQMNKKSPRVHNPMDWSKFPLSEKELKEIENLLKDLKDQEISAILKRIIINQWKMIRYFGGR